MQTETCLAASLRAASGGASATCRWHPPPPGSRHRSGRPGRKSSHRPRTAAGSIPPRRWPDPKLDGAVTGPRSALPVGEHRQGAHHASKVGKGVKQSLRSQKDGGEGARATSLLELGDGLITEAWLRLVHFALSTDAGQARQQLGGQLPQAAPPLPLVAQPMGPLTEGPLHRHELRGGGDPLPVAEQGVEVGPPQPGLQPAQIQQ